jgi:hypothetical protein
MDAGISLTELSETLLLSSRHEVTSPLSRHLLNAFGKKRLPAVAAYQGRDKATLDSVPQETWDRLRKQGILDTYLSWVQEALLRVIKEVVSSQQPDPCPVLGYSQQGF